MKQRTITGLIGGLIFISLVYLGGIWYSSLILLLAIIALYEFLRMAEIQPFGFPALLSYIFMLSILWPSLSMDTTVEIPVHFQTILLFMLLILLLYSVLKKNRFHIEHAALTLLGALYIGYGFLYMAVVRHSADGNGFWLTILILLGIWSTDTGAYLIGRKWGKRKLWPAISPNKTVEGSLGGLGFALLIVVTINQMVHAWTLSQALAIAITTGIAAQLGDLIESGMKRHFGVKDSGHILPGHGGVLDRFDSLLFVFPTLYLLGLI